MRVTLTGRVYKCTSCSGRSANLKPLTDTLLQSLDIRIHFDHETMALSQTARNARFLQAVENCKDAAIERDESKTRCDYTGKAMADAKMTKGLGTMADNAPTNKDATELRQVARNYEKGSESEKDRIIRALSTILLTAKLAGLAAVCALSCSIVGVPYQAVSASGLPCDGTLVDTGNGFVVTYDTNKNGFDDKMQSYDASGNAVGAEESLSGTDALLTVGAAALTVVACTVM
jgi:hypothetical protein